MKFIGSEVYDRFGSNHSNDVDGRQRESSINLKLFTYWIISILQLKLIFISEMIMSDLDGWDLEVI